MKYFFALFSILWFSKANAQLKPIDVKQVFFKPQLETDDGGYILGFEILYLTITDAWHDEKYDIYKISGYVQNAYNIESDDIFDINVYDSISAIKVRENLPNYTNTVYSTHSCTDRHGMFTIYLREGEMAEIRARFLSYPTRINILK